MAENTGKFYREIEDYVNKDVAVYATKIRNIESVRCARLNDHVYMEVIHEDSNIRYFNLTSFDVSNIGILVGYIVANIPIRREIHDREVKKTVRRLFK